jgi:hypothetical protein
MGLNSGKIRKETARLQVTKLWRRKSTGINRITVRTALALLITDNIFKYVFREKQLVEISINSGD